MIGLEHHRAILEAVRNGDENEAGRLMKNHLEMAYNNLREKDGKK
jgi:DNA-binding GntR family transcriptional regulator